MLNIRSCALLAALILPVLPQASLAQMPGRNNNDCILDNCRDRQPSGQNTQPGSDNNQPGGRRSQRDFDRPYGRDRSSDQDRGGRQRDRGDRRGGGGGEQYGARPGQFDFYVLSLSWSPSFCSSDAGRRSREQCAPGANNAFVVHGLWPQFTRGFPSYCDQGNPPRSALEHARGVYPEEGLARYEWRKHGTCSGLSAAEYFDLAGRIKAKIVIPEDLRRPNDALRKDPAEIQRAFLESNKSLREDMISVTCTRGQLEEVRICVAKDGKDFQSCPEVARAACRSGNISVPAPR